MLVKMVGPSPLMIFASRSMTARDADTNGAMSICLTVKLSLWIKMATHFIDHEEVGVSDTRPPLTRNFVSTLGEDGINRTTGSIDCEHYRNVDDIDNKIC